MAFAQWKYFADVLKCDPVGAPTACPVPHAARPSLLWDRHRLTSISHRLRGLLSELGCFVGELLGAGWKPSGVGRGRLCGPDGLPRLVSKRARTRGNEKVGPSQERGPTHSAI